jgi:uncharacterized protein
MKVVLDTNVVVSGLLTHHGACALVVDRMRMLEFGLCVNGAILAEYAEVLGRPRLSIPGGDADDFLEFVRHCGENVDAALLPTPLPDESDRPFLEVAAAAGALLVTGNARHFPKRARGGVEVVTPRELLDRLRETLCCVDPLAPPARAD